jgi:hypothetical protein
MLDYCSKFKWTPTEMRRRNYGFNVVAYGRCVEACQPEQAPTLVIDKVVTTNYLIAARNDLQDELDVIRDIFISPIIKVTQNLISRFCDYLKLLRIMKICISVYSLLNR